MATSSANVSWKGEAKMREVLLEILAVVRPLIELLVALGGPVIAGWLVAKLSATLKITDEKARVELEAGLRDALHKSAENGLRLALQRLGIKGGAPVLTSEIVEVAKQYVRQNNPDALAGLGVSADMLTNILTAKLPQVMAKTDS